MKSLFNLLIISITDEPVQMIITTKKKTKMIQSSIQNQRPCLFPIAVRCNAAGISCETTTPVKLPSDS